MEQCCNLIDSLSHILSTLFCLVVSSANLIQHKKFCIEEMSSYRILFNVILLFLYSTNLI